jgi:hypothetical protein
MVIPNSRIKCEIEEIIEVQRFKNFQEYLRFLIDIS